MPDRCADNLRVKPIIHHHYASAATWEKKNITIHSAYRCLPGCKLKQTSGATVHPGTCSTFNEFLDTQLGPVSPLLSRTSRAVPSSSTMNGWQSCWPVPNQASHRQPCAPYACMNASTQIGRECVNPEEHLLILLPCHTTVSHSLRRSP